MKSLYIKNYKNIKELTIDSLRSVNLIVGRNNVGKSTLLEALSIYAANGSDEQLKEVLGYRGEFVKDYIFNLPQEKIEAIQQRHFLSFFPNRKADFSEQTAIVIGETKQSDPHSITMYLSYIVKEEKSEDIFTMSEEQVAKNPLAIEIVGKGIEVTTTEGIMVIPFYRRISYNPITKKLPYQYVRASEFQSDFNSNLFDQASLLPEYPELIKALQIIEPKIDKLSFLREDNHASRIAYVVMKDSEQRLPLSAMGDGINRILTIILAMLNCKNGIFLLDEFETGLHYSVQTQLWKIIFMLSEKLNIQVFATSHSQDCINSFAKVNQNSKGQIIRIDKRREDIIVVNYNDEKELSFAVDNFIEIR